ncbi:hypothetical protein [Halobacillus sp. Marseille-P3879]|uniref:hypothetical protein n=1 Tax=Halobacillus sp. Marseille-P3879 TaxID=2045014 RepID=UPI000C7B35A2|nr:hypothetical protein [Halobacillus sp. Marseille-P3879]
MTGKVVNMLPKKQAIVQIGNQKLRAQLDASLTSGEHYLMQVKQINNNSVLKVISDRPLSSTENIIKVLKAVDKSPTALNISMVQQLINRG